jgi:hypothetical protein
MYPVPASFQMCLMVAPVVLAMVGGLARTSENDNVTSRLSLVSNNDRSNAPHSTVPVRHVLLEEFP